MLCKTVRAGHTRDACVPLTDISMFVTGISLYVLYKKDRSRDPICTPQVEYSGLRESWLMSFDRHHYSTAELVLCCQIWKWLMSMYKLFIYSFNNNNYFCEQAQQMANMATGHHVLTH